MQLVHILSTDGFDSALSTDLDPNNIFYLGLSLGGLMGSGLTPYVPEVQAVVLDAAGGNLSSELFLNSTIGSRALPLTQAIFQLDPANPIGDFSFFSALSQSVLDAGDGTANASHWVKDPFPTPFRPMNVLLLEDMNDQVVPNQANEALAVAAGLEIFDPHVQNLVATTRPLPLAPTQGFIDGNVAGTVTAGLFQVGPGAHAVIEKGVATLSLVPGFALIDEFRNADVATAFVPLIRQVRIKHPGVLDDILAWFRDIVNSGPPGRFAYTGAPLAFNSYQNQIIGKKKNTYIFFNRMVNADGVYGVFCSTSAVPFNQHLTGRSLTLKFPKNPQAPRSLVIRASIIDPTSTVTIDPTTTDIAVTVWEDRDNALFSQALIKDCWVNKKAGVKWIWKRSTCGGGDPGVFTRALLKKTAGTGGTTFKFVLKAKGDLGFATTTLGGGGAQVELGIAGETYNTSGGKCRRGTTSIACSKYD
ncbi:MAG: hypothetical protein ACE5I7_11055 [Candidatus Binatia bacterium]